MRAVVAPVDVAADDEQVAVDARRRAQQRRRQLIASTLPVTCPAMTSGPRCTATLPRTSWPGADLERDPTRAARSRRSIGRRPRAARRAAASGPRGRTLCLRADALAGIVGEQRSVSKVLRMRLRARSMLERTPAEGVRRGRSLASFVADRNAQPPHPAIQVGPVGLQPARRFGHVPARHRQRARDEHALVLVERVAQANARATTGSGRAARRRVGVATRARREAPRATSASVDRAARRAESPAARRCSPARARSPASA